MGRSYESFRVAFRQLIENRGITQAEIANNVGVTSKYISDITAERRRASHKLQEKIATALGYTYEDMLAMGRQILVGEKSATPQQQNNKIAARVEPGRPETRERLLQQQNSKPAPTEESFSMTIEVLESQTVYRSALASNVRAFHQAVKMEGEMHGVKDELQKMKEQHEADMAELKEMIRAMIAGQAAEKRDAAASA